MGLVLLCGYGHLMCLLLGASDDLKRVSEVAYTQVVGHNKTFDLLAIWLSNL